MCREVDSPEVAELPNAPRKFTFPVPPPCNALTPPAGSLTPPTRNPSYVRDDTLQWDDPIIEFASADISMSDENAQPQDLEVRPVAADLPKGATQDEDTSTSTEDDDTTTATTTTTITSSESSETSESSTGSSSA
jgi:hypothetical protein